jgi:hypothetical protein
MFRIIRMTVNLFNRLQKIPWLWSRLVRWGTRIGIAPQNWLLLESMSRPWWLYRSRGNLALATIERRPPHKVAASDIALCERLIAAFGTATGHDKAKWETRGMWAWLFDMYQRPLGEALQQGDPAALAELLASMFQSDFTNGLMTHAHARNSHSWLGARILSLKSLDTLVSLAEALGVVPVEGPEQRRAGVVYKGDITDLLHRIDQAVGVPVTFPDVGGPFGISVDDRLITLETAEQIYGAVRLDQAITTRLQQLPYSDVKLVEIGGGYGGMCYWFLRMRPGSGPYTIIDLPVMNVLQGYFLTKTLGADVVSLYGEPDAHVRILPNSALPDVDTPFQVLVNKDSMPEMPYAAMMSYLEWAREHCDGFIYSYNHEVTREFLGHKAGSVPEAVNEVGGLDRISRDHSWLRRGYAEEIYISSQLQPAVNPPGVKAGSTG